MSPLVRPKRNIIILLYNIRFHCTRLQNRSYYIVFIFDFEIILSDVLNLSYYIIADTKSDKLQLIHIRGVRSLCVPDETDLYKFVFGRNSGEKTKIIINILPITAMMVKHDIIKFRFRQLNGSTVA